MFRILIYGDPHATILFVHLSAWGSIPSSSYFTPDPFVLFVDAPTVSHSPLSPLTSVVLSLFLCCCSRWWWEISKGADNVLPARLVLFFPVFRKQGGKEERSEARAVQPREMSLIPRATLFCCT